MKWTLQHVISLKDKGKIVGYSDNGKQSEEVKKGKYRNKKITENGIVFDSKKEYCRYKELMFLQSIGEVSEVQRQVAYELGVCKYIADHVYKDKSGNIITEDVKSKHTRTLPVYRLKKKLMQKVHNITIKEF